MYISGNDIKKYIDIYLYNKSEEINFDALFVLSKTDLAKKEWLLNLLHSTEDSHTIPFKVSDMINDYTMHLILIFFILNSSNNMFNYIEKNFIEEYVQNESEIEGIDENTEEGKKVRAGLEVMYRFLNSKENNSTTGSIMLTDLHEKLFSYIQDGRYARAYRSQPVTHFFPGIEIVEPSFIPREMRQTDRMFDELYAEAETIYDSEIEDRIHMINPFLEKVMKYSVEVIRIQPFPDGNKRSTRGVINFLFKKAGLPPVYVKSSEDKKYKDALFDAMKNQNYETITNFYKNKLCDSIEELVINPFEAAIEVYKQDLAIAVNRKLDGKNTDRLFKKELLLVKPNENHKK